jgi:hypothetical protein
MTRARSLSKLVNASSFTVDSNFNVGVGSTTPVQKLNVVGVVSATSFAGDGSALTGIANTATILSDSITVAGITTIDASGVRVTGVTTSTTFSGSGASLTNLNATQLASGTVPDARFPATLPAVSGANLTDLNIPAGFNELDAALFN